MRIGVVCLKKGIDLVKGIMLMYLRSPKCHALTGGFKRREKSLSEARMRLVAGFFEKETDVF